MPILKQIISLSTWILITYSMLGCQASPPHASESDGRAIATPTATPPIVPTPTHTPEPDHATTTLTIWTVEQISPYAKGDTGSFIDKSLHSFEKSNPNTKVEIFLKKPNGKGGILDFLKTTKEVAPSILPDVVIMNSTDLEQAYTNGLIIPLDDRLDRTIIKDLLPAARKMGTVAEKLVGVPLGLEIEHTIYNTRTFTTPTVLWTNILSSNAKYVFPAKGVHGLVNDTTLAQYFALGGRLVDERGAPKIDERALKQILIFYQEAINKKIIVPTILEVATSEEVWPSYVTGKTTVAQVSVRQYLTERKTLKNTTWGNIVPMKESLSVPIMRGWALTLVTTDMHRQKAALNLLEWFLSTSNNVTWNSLNKSIPPRDAAFQRLAGSDPYWQFLAEQLNTARPLPSFNGYDQVGQIIQQAVEQVIRGEASPDQATATAIDALAK